MARRFLSRRAAESEFASGEMKCGGWQNSIGPLKSHQRWDGSCLPLCISTMHFYESAPTMDIDNIPKPITDALKGLVYLDDEQVTDVLCRKRNLIGHLRLENPSGVLAEGLSRGSQFLDIAVEEAPRQEVISCWKLQP